MSDDSDCKSPDEIEDFCNTVLHHVGHELQPLLEDLIAYLDPFETQQVIKEDITHPEYSAIRAGFFKIRNKLDLFEKIKAFVKDTLQSKQLKATQIFTKALLFKKLAMANMQQLRRQTTMNKRMKLSNNSEPTNDCKWHTLSFACKVALSEFVVTQYHQQFLNLGWLIADCLEKCALLRELSNSDQKTYETTTQWIKEYMEWYQKNIYVPLPRSRNYLTKVQTINHHINIVFKYLQEINAAVYDGHCFGNLNHLQLDVFFVLSNEHSNERISDFCDKAKQNNIEVLKCDKSTFDHDANVCCGAHRLLRTAKHELNLTFGDRIVMIIVRSDPLKSDNDTVYLYHSKNSNDVSLPNAAYSELPWIYNTKSDIIPGLNPEKHGILTVSHHLHSHDCQRVFISVKNHGSRVLNKYDFIKHLPMLFKLGYDQISEIRERDFQANFRDLNYRKYGEYLFGPITYNCYEPAWNDINPRANFNLFVEPDTTQKLLEYIDEQNQFENNRGLYYNLDYTYAMQFQDKGMICIEFMNDNGDEPLMLLIGTKLHKNKKTLYALAVNNDRTAVRQKWKMRMDDDGNIGSSFMTKSELCAEFSIHEMDLPKSAKIKIDRIEIDSKVLAHTKWNDVHINSGCNNGKSRRWRKCKGPEYAKVWCCEFENMVNQQKHNPCAAMVSFTFGKSMCCPHYSTETALPVQLSGNQWIAVIFRYNSVNQELEVKEICLDLLDCKNKSALINVGNGAMFGSIMKFKENIKSLRIVQLPKNSSNNNKKNKNNDDSNNNNNKSCRSKPMIVAKYNNW